MLESRLLDSTALGIRHTGVSYLLYLPVHYRKAWEERSSSSVIQLLGSATFGWQSDDNQFGACSSKWTDGPYLVSPFIHHGSFATSVADSMVVQQSRILNHRQNT